MSDPGKLPEEDGAGLVYYVIVLILAFLMFGGMLALATKPLWQ
jgi:hypothetical protein